VLNEQVKQTGDIIFNKVTTKVFDRSVKRNSVLYVEFLKSLGKLNL